MIAAASPGARSNVTPDSTRSAPRGVGYSLESSVTWSTPCPLAFGLKAEATGNRFVDCQQAIGRALDAVLLADAGETATAELGAADRILPQRMERIGEGLGVV